MAQGESLLVERDGELAVLTLHRPGSRNAIDDELRERLGRQLEELSRDDQVSVVILTGSGPAFCAGGDVRGMRERLEAPAGAVAVAGWRRQQRTFALVSALHRLGQVTIAAVNGPAVGLGLDIALACDFIVASSDAWFAASFIDRGLVPDGGGMYYLPRRVGLPRTKELIFSGRRVEAAEAAAIGLADVLVDDGRLLDAAREYARRFTGRPRGALMLMKSIVNRTFEQSLEVTAALGAEAQAICYTTDEHREAVRAFLGDRRDG